MHILATFTAYSPHYYSQREVVDALRAFAHRPHLFREMLAVQMGEASLSLLTLRRGPELGALLLAPRLA
ncbi:MAG: hypothetical protein WA374_05660 [Acidobacteriaceae bacterium]